MCKKKVTEYPVTWSTRQLILANSGVVAPPSSLKKLGITGFLEISTDTAVIH